MTELWVERTGVRRYTGHSSRGAEVLVGSEDVEGVFTPGELMKIALVLYVARYLSDHPAARFGRRGAGRDRMAGRRSTPGTRSFRQALGPIAIVITTPPRPAASCGPCP